MLEQLATGAPAVSRRQSEARLVAMAQPSAHPLHASWLDNVRTWYAVVACIEVAGWLHVTRRLLAAASRGEGLEVHPDGRSAVRLRAFAADTERVDESSAHRVPQSRVGEVKWMCW